ncbi:MAG TPA: hypothetical protein VHV26_00425 [Rhizomicrobium sp.]|jgi:tetratricopeptide (TPR) repeat protein|nr:hypothetical protein [Rhizomicrobium sp.]
MRRAAFALLLAASPVAAKAADSPYAIYAAGHYEEAMHAGEAARNAAGLAIAARAALADAMERPQPCMICLQRAESFANRAIAAGPGYADGQVWLAVALGYESRLTGPLRARLARNPERAKEALERALRADPANPYALSALGGWHIEIVRLGGDFLARHIYGAEEATGLALFDRAVKAAPANVAVHYQIALSLAGYDPARFKDRIRRELEAAVAAAPATAYERFVRGRAAELLALHKSGDDTAFSETVRHDQGYP